MASGRSNSHVSVVGVRGRNQGKRRLSETEFEEYSTYGSKRQKHSPAMPLANKRLKLDSYYGGWEKQRIVTPSQHEFHSGDSMFSPADYIPQQESDPYLLKSQSQKLQRFSSRSKPSPSCDNWSDCQPHESNIVCGSQQDRHNEWSSSSDLIPNLRKHRKLEDNESSLKYVQHERPCQTHGKRKRSDRIPSVHSPGNWSQKKKRSSSPKEHIRGDSSWNFSADCMMSMAELPREDLIEKLSDEIKTFQCTLAKKDLLDKQGVMDALIKMLSKLADPVTLSNEALHTPCLQILAVALSDRCAVFWLCLKIYIGSGKKQNLSKIQCLCHLFQDILSILPSSSKSWLPVEELQSATEHLNSSSLLNDLKALLLRRDSIREEHSRRNNKGDFQSCNNYKYKEIEIFPHWNELCISQKPFLSKNIIRGGYVDWQHYFGVQFQLLREDFIAPLRKGICEYLNGANGRKLSNVRVYKKVLLKKPILKSPAGVCYKIEITDLGRSINWEHSKRLVHGSLLCLTPEHDNFKDDTFFAAVIEKEIHRGELVIMFKEGAKMLQFSCKGIFFTMVESCSNFETSRLILRSVQTAETDTMPFTKHLIEGDSRAVKQPCYLISPSSYNLTSLLTEEAKDYLQKDYSDALSDGNNVKPRRSECFLVKHVTDDKQWPTCDQTGLDASQLKGIHMALTQEIALIQGPPGTGKTYVGLKIVEALLNNARSRKFRPLILVMCLTNHALDQFLEGILRSPLFKDNTLNLIRVGRSQSEELAKFNLVEARKKVRTRLPVLVRKEKNLAEQKVREFMTSNIFPLSAADHVTISLEKLSEHNICNPEHHSQLFDLAQTHQQLSCVLEMWLGLETSDSYWNRIDSVREINRILRYGFSLAPMPEEEVMNIVNVRALRIDDRWRLYQYWHSQYLKRVCEQEFLEYNRLCSVQDKARKKADCFSLKTADIIGMTTAGAAKYQHILHLIKPRVVIVEEAAEVLESHIVSVLNAGTQHLILIGDHKQLRPKLNDYELGKKYNLDISLFERLILNDFPHVTLEYQHRMRPEIAELVKPHIYSVLSNHPSVEGCPNIRGVSTNLFFVKHDFPEKENDLLSHSNYHEADYLVSLCRYLLQQQYNPEQITVLVTYTGQLRRVKEQMTKTKCEGVRVSTVDNFQGEENDIILLSLVRSNSERNVGFLKEENRVCVALSRARQGFYCIGNFDMLREQVPLWEKIMVDMEKKGKRFGEGLLLRCNNHPEIEFVAKSSKDFEEKSPGGGCFQDCNIRLECGHTCAQKCHSTDPEHANYNCMKKCTKSCLQGHPCHRYCYESCGRCVTRVLKLMPSCGHKQEMPCYKNPSEVDCSNPCKNECPKGHKCPLACHKKCQPCQVKISFVMDSCQHKQWIKCHQDPKSILCKQKCSRKCTKGHTCRKRCHEDCGNCEMPVLKTIQVCNHQVKLPCYVEPNHSECTVPCRKTLPCNHKCQLKCGEDCSTSLCMEIVTAELPTCKHHIKVPCHESQDLSKIPCDKECERFLSCEHRCDLACGKPCQTQCKVLVNKIWPCGHKLERPCYQFATPEEFPCEEKCRKEFACGHLCSRNCGQVCDDECQHVCSHKLSCGHNCNGKCSQCTNEHVHKLCPFKREIKRFCGHSFPTSCSGLMDDHLVDQHLPIVCCHETKQMDCSVDVGFHFCYEKCLWNCAHFKCSKSCDEMCDRSRCDECCTKLLKCGHKCYGLCGEPCLTLCPICQLELFEKKLKHADRFNQHGLYYELDCKHIFTVKYLDEHVHQLTNPQSHVLVCPIQCPVKECSQPLSCSYRYGNDVKLCLSYVQNVIQIINSEIEDKLHCTFLSNELTMFEGLTPNIDEMIHACSFRTRTSDGRYLVSIFTVTMNIFNVPANLQSSADVTHSRTIFNELKRFLSIVSKLINEAIKLTYQAVDDLQSEFFRLYLQLYVLLAKLEAKSVHSDNAIKSVPPPFISPTENQSNATLGSVLTSASSSLNPKASSNSQSESGSSPSSECPAVETAPPDPILQSGSKDVIETMGAINPAIVAAEEYLKDVTTRNLKVTKFHVNTHCKAMGEFTNSTCLNYKKMLEKMDKLYPVVQKGQWWRCPSGEYYCLPLSSYGDDDEMKCPKCEGSYKRIRVLTKEKISQQVNQDDGKTAASGHKQQKRCGDSNRGHHNKEKCGHTNGEQLESQPDRSRRVEQDLNLSGHPRKNQIERGLGPPNRWQQPKRSKSEHNASIVHHLGPPNIRQAIRLHEQPKRSQAEHQTRHLGLPNRWHQSETPKGWQSEHLYGEPSIEHQLSPNRQQRWQAIHQPKRGHLSQIEHRLGPPNRRQDQHEKPRKQPAAENQYVRASKGRQSHGRKTYSVFDRLV